MRYTKLLVGLILLPSLTLASESTFAISFTASGDVNGTPFTNQVVTITGTFDTEYVYGDATGLQQWVAPLHNLVIHVGGSVFEQAPFPGEYNLRVGYYNFLGAFSLSGNNFLIETDPTSAGSSYNLRSSFASQNVAVDNIGGVLDGHTSSLHTNKGPVTFTKSTSQGSVTVVVTPRAKPVITPVTTPPVYEGVATPSTKVALFGDGTVTLADPLAFSVLNSNLPSGTSGFGSITVTPSGGILYAGQGNAVIFPGSSTLNFTSLPLPGIVIGATQVPFANILLNNTTSNGNPVTQVQSFPSLLPSFPTTLTSFPAALNAAFATGVGGGSVAVANTGSISVIPFTLPGGSITTIPLPSFSFVSGLTVTPSSGLVVTGVGGPPAYPSFFGSVSQGQFHKFTEPVAISNPGNPRDLGCGNIALNHDGGQVDVYNTNTSTDTPIENISTQAGVYQLVPAGPYLLLIATDGTVQRIDMNFPVPCYDTFQKTASAPAGVRARSGSPDASATLSGGIVMGPDGAMWFTNGPANAIGRVTGSGALDSFATVSPASGPMGIAIGSDGNYWIAETAANKIQQTTAFGVSQEFAGLSANSAPANIVAGPDGALWFNESGTGKMGRITTAGVVTEFAATGANSIAAGPDGAVWYTESGAAKIGRITTAGAIGECTLSNTATQIAAGPDGAMWFTEGAANKIGRLTTDGACILTEYSAGLTANAGLDAITLGSDGYLWFTEDAAKNLGRIEPESQTVTEYALPPGLSSSVFSGIAVGEEGGVWIAGNAGEIVRLLVPAGAMGSEITVGTNPPGQAFTFDGNSLTSAQTFSAPLGLDHTLAVTVPAAANGTRMSFAGWSDGGATASETITCGPVPSMHLANLNVQYQLTTAASPAAGGSVTAVPSSPDGLYNAGAVVQLSATANPGYQFTGWSGDVSGSAVPASVTMAAPHTVTATFAATVSGAASPVSASPAAGSQMTQTFTFTFSDTAGTANLQIVDVLINNFLDGRHGCYVAFQPSSNSVFLVDDAGDAGGPYSGMVLPGNGTVQNSQCSIAAAGSSVAPSGNTLTLMLAITFSASFTGNKVIYMSAQDKSSLNLGWSAQGTWNVPGAAISGPSVTGMSPGRTSGDGPTAYTFTFNDTNGFADIGVANVLVNNFIDGRHGCFVAFLPATGSVLLVDDAGDAGGPYSGMVLPGTGTVSNSQCTITGQGSSFSGSGNTLTLTLSIAFSHGFAGNRVFYVAGRSNTANSDWQAVGSAAVQ